MKAEEVQGHVKGQGHKGQVSEKHRDGRIWMETVQEGRQLWEQLLSDAPPAFANEICPCSCQRVYHHHYRHFAATDLCHWRSNRDVPGGMPFLTGSTCDWMWLLNHLDEPSSRPNHLCAYPKKSNQRLAWLESTGLQPT